MGNSLKVIPLDCSTRVDKILLVFYGVSAEEWGSGMIISCFIAKLLL